MEYDHKEPVELSSDAGTNLRKAVCSSDEFWNAPIKWQYLEGSKNLGVLKANPVAFNARCSQINIEKMI